MSSKIPVPQNTSPKHSYPASKSKAGGLKPKPSLKSPKPADKKLTAFAQDLHKALDILESKIQKNQEREKLNGDSQERDSLSALFDLDSFEEMMGDVDEVVFPEPLKGYESEGENLNTAMKKVKFAGAYPESPSPSVKSLKEGTVGRIIAFPQLDGSSLSKPLHQDPRTLPFTTPPPPHHRLPHIHPYSTIQHPTAFTADYHFGKGSPGSPHFDRVAVACGDEIGYRHLMFEKEGKRVAVGWLRVPTGYGTLSKKGWTANKKGMEVPERAHRKGTKFGKVEWEKRKVNGQNCTDSEAKKEEKIVRESREEKEEEIEEDPLVEVKWSTESLPFVERVSIIWKRNPERIMEHRISTPGGSKRAIKTPSKSESWKPRVGGERK